MTLGTHKDNAGLDANGSVEPFSDASPGKLPSNDSIAYNSRENDFGLKMDAWSVYSRSGKAYPRTTPRDRNHVHELRVPYVKRVIAKGNPYFYFIGPSKCLTNRLPSPGDHGFANAYLNELAKLEGLSPEAYQAPIEEFVYFVGASIGAIKIGTSRRLERRLSDLQRGSPVILGFLAITVGGKDTESEYHRLFATHRAHGEWFERHPDILAEIERLNALPNPARLQEQPA